MISEVTSLLFKFFVKEQVRTKDTLACQSSALVFLVHLNISLLFLEKVTSFKWNNDLISPLLLGYVQISTVFCDDWQSYVYSIYGSVWHIVSARKVWAIIIIIIFIISSRVSVPGLGYLFWSIILVPFF